MNASQQQPQQSNNSNGGKSQLEFPIVSKIKGKKKAWMKSRNSVFGKEDEECIPLTLTTIHESHYQDFLLDRISALEDQILQLCSEIEMYKKSSISENLVMTDKSSEACSSSSSGSKMERMCSYPIFDLQNPQIRRFPPRVVFNDNLTFQEKNTNTVQQEQQIKISSSMKKQQKQGRGQKRERKTSRNGKKNNIFPTWPHLNLLGC